jgi:hypothetical protein
MPITPQVASSADLPVGGVWLFDAVVRDSDGCLTSDTLTVTVTKPDGTGATPVAELVTTGRYRVSFVATIAGRYVARVVGAAHGVATYAVHANAVTPGSGMPTLVDLRGDPDADPDPTTGYLGATSHTDDEIQDALDAEAANQRAVCDVPAEYTADLRQALLRRVARNLAMRRQKLGLIMPSDEASQATFIPRLDGEIRRLEGPHRRLPVG